MNSLNDWKERGLKYWAKQLQWADEKQPAGKFLKKGMQASAGAFFLAWIAGLLVSEDIGLDAAIGLCTGLVIGSIYLQRIKWKVKQRAEQFEYELPNVLQNWALDLELGVSFEQALTQAGKCNGIAGKEFQQAGYEIRKLGKGVTEALQGINERIHSRPTERVIQLLGFVYAQGGEKENRCEPLKAMAAELRALERNRVRAFGQKQSMASLVYITVSGVVPAVFLSFIVLGAQVLELEMTGLEILGMVWVGIPAVTLMVLGILHLQTPVSLRLMGVKIIMENEKHD